MSPDQEVIGRFLQDPTQPLAVDSSALTTALGMKLVKIDLAQSRLELEYLPQPLFVQGMGVLQGGAVSAMLDFAMAFVVLAHRLDAKGCATVNLNASFLRPAPQGAYKAIGSIDKMGRNMAFTQARLERLEDGEPVATASSTLAVVYPDRSQAQGIRDDADR
jgi:uncharacterized protein (TIGR00369 family)